MEKTDFFKKRIILSVFEKVLGAWKIVSSASENISKYLTVKFCCKTESVRNHAIRIYVALYKCTVILFLLFHQSSVNLVVFVALSYSLYDIAWLLLNWLLVSQVWGWDPSLLTGRPPKLSYPSHFLSATSWMCVLPIPCLRPSYQSHHWLLLYVLRTSVQLNFRRFSRVVVL